MARVTVEDCLENVVNRFALVHATSQRVMMMYQGSPDLVDCDNREIVTALREIGDGFIKLFDLPEEDPTTAKKKAKSRGRKK